MAESDPSMEHIDFSTLPDVVWVRIMSFLPLSAKNVVAQTCHSLYEVFNHPSVWYSVEMIFLADLCKYSGSQHGVIIPQRYIAMIDRFGPYFQDLTLIFEGYFTRMPAELRDVLEKLAESCRLRSLTLEVGSGINSMDYFVKKARPVDLNAIVTLVSSVKRLTSFTLKSWPMYPNAYNVSILDILIENKNVHDLEDLSLYWVGANEATWASLNIILPRPEEMLATIQVFCNLRSLSLRSTMISNSLIVELARSYHYPLDRLGVLVTYSRSNPDGALPDISSASWLSLRERCPNLQVDFTIVTRVPYIELAGLLKLEIPVTSISFMTHSRCGAMDVVSITEKYHNTLRKFVSYVDSEIMDNELLAMTTRCPKMDYLVYCGKIHCDTVLALAKLRGTKWYTFRMDYPHIILSPYAEKMDEDEDTVIKMAEDGSVSIVHRNSALFEEDTDRKTKLETLVKEVGMVIGQKWHPWARTWMHDEMW